MNFNLNSILRRDLNKLVPYNVPRIPAGTIKLDANENPFDFPADILAEICDRLKQPITRYPDPLAAELTGAISEYTGVPVEGIMAGNGSDEVILNLLLTFGSGGQVVIAVPTFSMYRIYSLIAGAVPVEVFRTAGFGLDIDALCRAAGRAEARVVILCSPNNPTGNAASTKEIATLLECSRALVVVDEAYIDFGGESCLKLLKGYPNLVILRTFSKAFGMAGLRVGYLLGNPAVVKELLRVKQPFNLNTFSQAAACTVLARKEEFKSQVQKILAYREKLAGQLATLPGIDVFPSQANFILFRTRLPAKDIFESLLKEGILIRSFRDPELKDCLRVTVGREQENEIFLEKIRKIVNA